MNAGREGGAAQAGPDTARSLRSSAVNAGREGGAAQAGPDAATVGLLLTQAARLVRRAFDEALADAGGSLPVWLVLLHVKTGRPSHQRDLAAAVGVREATLTQQLAAMEAAGLVVRTRDAANRRIQVVALTDAGEAAFQRLRAAAVAFDARLRAGLGEDELAALAALLDRIAANAAQ